MPRYWHTCAVAATRLNLGLGVFDGRTRKPVASVRRPGSVAGNLTGRTRGQRVPKVKQQQKKKQPCGDSSRGWWVGKGNFNWFELVIQIISAFFSIYILILSAFNGLVEDFLFALLGNNSWFSARYCRPEFSLWGTKSGTTWEASQLLLDCLTGAWTLGYLNLIIWCDEIQAGRDNGVFFI